jgi:hypothetical protein
MVSIRDAQRVLLTRFVEQTAAAVSSLGWTADPTPPGSGRLHEARQALTHYRQLPKRGADEAAMYDRFADQLLRWLNDQQ